MRGLTFVGGLLLSSAVACANPDAPGPEHTVIVVEPGGPVTEIEIDLVTGIVIEQLAGSGNTISLLHLDGPNADVASSVALPGVTPGGELDTEAVNRVARRDAAAAVEDGVRDTLLELFERSPGLDRGRDLLGALARAAEQNPDRLVLVSTSGGVHRSGAEDFLDVVPERADTVVLPPEAAVELYGIGDVPAAEGTVPDPDWTSALVEYWRGFCASTEADCEVIR